MFPNVTEMSNISMSSTFDAKAIKRARTSSQPYTGSERSAIIVSPGGRSSPTGSVSMMTLLLAIIINECYAAFMYNNNSNVKNFHALGLHLTRNVLALAEF